MTSRIARTTLAIGVAMTLTACGGSVGTTAPTSVNQTTPPSPTTAPTPSATSASPAPSAAVTSSPAASATARNGVIVYSDAAGEIYSLDPATGKAKLLIGGPTKDLGPEITPDGQHFIFVRVDDDKLYIAKADGSDVRFFADPHVFDHFEFSPRGDRIASVQEGGGNPAITDLASGARRVISLTKPVIGASWLTDDSLLVFEETEAAGSVAMWTVNADGTNQQAIHAPSMCCGVSTLSGRGLIAWNSWPSGKQGSVHVLDVATGNDMLIASSDVPGFHFLEPHFSPDGKWLTAKRIQADVDGVQLALLAADGSGKAIAVGPMLPTNNGQIRPTFSPDGTKLLITDDDGSAWLHDLPGGTGGKTDWPGLVEATWQALPATQ